MNTNRRFSTLFVAYLVYVGLLGAALATPGGVPGAGAPRGELVVALALLVTWPIPLLLALVKGSGWKETVRRSGRLAPARVISVRNADGGREVVELTVRVMPQDEAAFLGRLEVYAPGLAIPVGDEAILVRYDPADHRHIALSHDFGAASLETPYDPSALAASLSQGRTGALARQLRELEDRRRAGALSEQEFRTARKMLLA